MVKNLFICDTPFQVLVSLIIAWSRFGASENDFLLTDNMTNAEEILLGLKKSNSVRDVELLHVKHAGELHIENKINYFFDLILRYDRRWANGFCDRTYDNFFVRNFSDPIACSSFNYFKNKNNMLKLFVYDEGYSSYSRSYWFSEFESSFFHKVSNQIACLLGKSMLFKHISSAYMFKPELLHVELPFEIKKLLPEDYIFHELEIEKLNQIFNFDRDNDPLMNLIVNQDPLSRKWIFFEESFAEDLGNNNDLEILNVISNIVGKENVVIKLHPRSTVDRFTPLGYRVAKTASYPWEIFMLNISNKSNLTLVSYTSGSLINYHFLSETLICSVFLYNLFPDACQNLQGETKLFFVEFCKEFPDSIHSPRSINELRKVLFE